MPTITVRNVDADTVHALKQLAALEGRSMEAEIRVILTQAVGAQRVPENRGLGTRISERFADLEWTEPAPRRDAPRHVIYE